MDNVSFQEEEQVAPLVNKKDKKKQNKGSFFVDLVIKTKIAKDEKEANPILITMALCFFITSGIIIYWEFFPPPKFSYEKAIQANAQRMQAKEAPAPQTAK